MDRRDISYESRKRRLYDQLLDCTKSRLNLLSTGEPWETMAEPFLKMTEKWDELRIEIELLNEESLSLGESDSSLREIMEEISTRLQETDVLLHNSVQQAGDDLKLVKDQQKLMNAYYGMDRKGHHAYYFDEKK